MFWTDLAYTHYSNKALRYLSDINIEVVPKNYNPANYPELRPKEDFWSELKRMMYDKCWEANNLEQLRNRIDYAFKNAYTIWQVVHSEDLMQLEGGFCYLKIFNLINITSILIKKNLKRNCPGFY